MQYPRPPWTRLGRRLESLSRKALLEFEMLAEGAPVGIALSGGKDSLTLLFLLHAMRGRGLPNFEIHALHVSGAFSCGPSMQSRFLEPICRDMGIELHVAEANQSREGLECYSCSRRRRTLLFDMAKKSGIERIAFGHHRDDNIQTLLMNVMHKAEFEPLAPKIYMRDYGCTIIRPLIFAEESEIISFADQNGFRRITCQCPVGQNSKRRQTEQLIDEIERIFPNARTNLAQAGFAYGKKHLATLDPLELEAGGALNRDEPFRASLQLPNTD